MIEYTTYDKANKPHVMRAQDEGLELNLLEHLV